MPEQPEAGDPHAKIVEHAARLLQTRGERVTYRAVAKRIERTHGHGISMRDIVVPLTAWKAHTRYEYSHLEAARLPERLERLLATFGQEVLELALARAENDVRAEREEIATERRELAACRDALLGEIGELQAAKAKLEEEIRALRGMRGRPDWQAAREAREAAERDLRNQEQLRHRLDEAERIADGLALAGLQPPAVQRGGGNEDGPDATRDGLPREDFEGFVRNLIEIGDARAAGRPVRPNRPDEMTPRRYWDWVMREIVAQMEVRGPLYLWEIRNILPKDLHDEAQERGDPLDEDLLKRKLAIRVAAGRYFMVLDDGRYGLLG
jgi:hypothetical protein